MIYSPRVPPSRPITILKLGLLLVAIPPFFPLPADGEVTRFHITSRTPYAEGKSFGEAGAYEQIVGRVDFALDIKLPGNQQIVDLRFSPRRSGVVEFSCDLFLLTPRDPSRGNGAIFYDVNNRGNKLALRFFNDAEGGNDARDPGNGYLLRSGYTVVWSGWDGELLSGDGRLRLTAPVARSGEHTITGPVRYEICPEKEATRLSVVRPGHGAYRPTPGGMRSATLTWRLYPQDRRIPVPRDQFILHVTDVDPPSPGQLPLVEVEVPAGFRRGFLYELIYEAQDPLVHGVCFAEVRDLISSLKHGTGSDHPLVRDGRTGLQFAYGFGVSQSGRFLRELVYSGFNADEQGRIVFDGMIPHVAGGGLGSFNHRFAQPTAFGTQHEQHDWCTDRFPFAYEEQEDPFTNHRDSILRRAEEQQCVPKIFHTQSSTEYWTRAGSLPHTDPQGRRDAEVPATVRIYAFGGTQHGPANWPVEKGTAQAAPNPGDYRPLLRGLLDRLDRWCRHGEEPPPSVYPTLREGTLVAFHQPATGFPSLPGLRYPEVIRQPSLLDFGRRWETERIMDEQPPTRRSDYQVLVPRCDKDGNELGCLLPPEVGVPLATFTGWAVRTREAGAENDLVGLNGSYLPFAGTLEARRKTGDPRLSLAERYQDFESYVKKLRENCRRLQAEGYLLEEDVERVVERQRERARPLFPDADAGSPE